jgi:hypothetical protein
LCILHFNGIFEKGLACGIRHAPSTTLLPKGASSLYSNTMWFDRIYVVCYIGESGVLWVCFILLVPPVGNIRQPKCTANFKGVEVVVITFWINLTLVLWCFRCWIQIQHCSRQ